MARKYLLEYSKQLAVDVEKLCQNTKMPFNYSFQIRKSASSVFANISEAKIR